MAEAEVGGMVERRRLFRDGLRDLRAAVAVDVRPDRGISVEVFPALRIPQPNALGADDHQRFVRGVAPRVLRGERVPAMGFVGVDGIGHAEDLTANGRE